MCMKYGVKNHEEMCVFIRYIDKWVISYAREMRPSQGMNSITLFPKYFLQKITSIHANT